MTVGYADIVELAKNGWDEFIAAGSSDGTAAARSHMGRATAHLHQPEHVHERAQRARDAVLDVRRRASRRSELDLADIERAEVAIVREFQALVDHYMPTTRH